MNWWYIDTRNVQCRDPGTHVLRTITLSPIHPFIHSFIHSFVTHSIPPKQEHLKSYKFLPKLIFHSYFYPSP